MTRFSASTVDQMPRHVAAGHVFGSPVAIPVPDLDRTDHLVILGANPYASNGSVCTAPDFPGRLEAIQERGGKVVVVDPRRSRTAEQADEWVSIRPGTDALLLAAIAQVLIDEGLADVGDHVRAHVDGVERLGAALAPFTPEAVAGPTGVAAATIRTMARRTRGGSDGRRLRPDRDHDHRVRFDGIVVGRRRQHAVGQPRPTRRLDVRHAGRRGRDDRVGGRERARASRWGAGTPGSVATPR